MDERTTPRPNVLEDILQLLPRLRQMVSIQEAELPRRTSNRLESILHLVTNLVESLPDCEIKTWRMPEDEEVARSGRAQRFRWDRRTHQLKPIAQFPRTSWIPEIHSVVRTGGFRLIDSNRLSRLVLRAIVPSLKVCDEHFLVFDILQLSGNKWEIPTASLLDSISETYLNTLRSSDLLEAYAVLDGLITGGTTDERLLNEARNILYLKARLNQLRIAAEFSATQKNETSLLEHYNWWNHPGLTVPMDANDDWVAAILIQSLISQATEPNPDAIRQLIRLFKSILASVKENTLHEMLESRNLVINQDRGPNIAIPVSAFQSWHSISEALARLSNINLRDVLLPPELSKEVTSIDLLSIASRIGHVCEPIHSEQKLWYWASELTMLSNRAKAMSRTQGDDQARELLRQTIAISEMISPYLHRFLGKKEDKKIRVSSNWLEVWLGLQLINANLLGENTEGGRSIINHIHPDGLRQLVDDWATYFRYLLTLCESNGENRPTDERRTHLLKLHGGPEPEAVDAAKLNLLCEWAHYLGVPRLIPLQKWLETTYASELALYSLSSKGSHRQHLFHVQDVCLLGCVLLYGRIGGTSLNGYLSNLTGVDNETLFRNWLVASLLHDLGYMLQVIPRGMDALGKDTADAMSPVLDEIRKKLKQAPAAMSDSDPTPGKSTRHLDVENHAYVSVRTVQQILDRLLDEGNLTNEYNMALTAIIEHDAKDVRIDLHQDPLSALIVLCDQLQEWGRPRLSAELLNRRFMSAIHRVQETKIPQILLQSINLSPSLYICASWDNDHLDFGQPNSLKFILKEHTAGEAGCEPAIAWLDICRAFQRIRSSQNTLTIDVTLQHNLARDGISELRRLHAFAQKESSARGGILDWVELVGRGKNDALVYKINGTLETLTFKIPKVGNQKTLFSIPSGLYRDFIEFKRIG